MQAVLHLSVRLQLTGIEPSFRRAAAITTIAIKPHSQFLQSGFLRGERVAVQAEDQELSPTEASAILGVSRPLVVFAHGPGRSAIPLRQHTPPRPP